MASNNIKKFTQNIQNRYKTTDSINIHLENKAKNLFKKFGLSFQKIPTLNHNNKLPQKIEGVYTKEKLSLRKNPRVSDKKAEAVAMHEIYHHIQKDKGMNLSDEETEAKTVEIAYLNPQEQQESIDFDLIYSYTIKQFYDHNELEKLVSIFGGDEQTARVLYTKAMSVIHESQKSQNKTQKVSKSSNLSKVSNQIKLKENKTGLPDNLKSNIEYLSGLSMDDVKVHYNSLEPERFNAHAFAKGSDIHLSFGAEKHLPHEAWHVVQQKQGKVQATKQFKNIELNDNEELEKEATLMGEKALNIEKNIQNPLYKTAQNSIIQREIKTSSKRKINKNSITDTIVVEVKKGIKSKYVEVTFGGSYSVITQFTVSKSSINADASVEANDQGDIALEGSIELFNAKEAGKKRIKELIDTGIENGGFEVDKIEVLFQFENKESEQETSQAQGVKLTFHNKQEMVIKFNTFKLSKGEVSFLNLNIEHTIAFNEVTLWEEGDKKLTGKNEIKLIGEIQPNWTTILAQLAEKGFSNVAKDMLRNFMATLTIEGLVIAGFILGGVATLFSFYAMLDDIDDIDRCTKNAIKALHNFVAGYCSGFGISISADNSAQIFVKGREKAQEDLTNIILAIQKNPLFSAYNFKDEELRPGIVAKIQQYPKELYSMAKQKYQKEVYQAYIMAFYKKKQEECFGILESKESCAYKEAKHVAYRLGLKPSEVLPKPKD